MTNNPWHQVLFPVLLVMLAGYAGESFADETSRENQNGAAAVMSNIAEWFGGTQDTPEDTLDFSDTRDFERAERGFIAQIEPAVIKDEQGRTVFDAERYDFLSGAAPDNVNPSFWRQSALVAKHGLFKVSDGIYQVRGYDLANITFIQGETGWIVVDPLLTREAAAAAKQLLDQQLGQQAVSAVVLTHSHVDHYAGVRGILSDQDIENGVPLVAPAHFAVEAISENVLAGNAMSRRAGYMFGSLLDVGPEANLGVGLGPGLSEGNLGMMIPTVDVVETGQTLILDGVKFEFILALGAEAPSEFMFYLPQFRAFCQAEIINHTLHNLLTPRGAKVRNGKIWAEYIDEAIVAYADKTDVSFGSHHWPTWGQENIEHLWTVQRDLYRFIHDQTLRLANQGHTINEIPSLLKLPAGLASEFANRSYYGELGFNARSQYQLYFGFFDGNPVNLNPLPVREESTRYVTYMGGADSVIKQVRAELFGQDGLKANVLSREDYQFAATVLNHVVFAEPENAKARDLLAWVYRKMASTTESGPHRNFYLSGAHELQNGVSNVLDPGVVGEDTIRALPLNLFFDLLAVRFNAEKAGDREWVLNFNVRNEDADNREQSAMLFVSNGVLHHRMGVNSEAADATLSITRKGLDELNLKRSGILSLVVKGEASISGNPLALRSFFALIEEPNPAFNIVTP